MAKITRKDFLRVVAAGLGTLVGGELLAGCSPAPAVPSATGAQRAQIIKIYPAAKSRVVHAHHAAAWNGDKLNPQAIRQMLDASITRLTGKDDPIKAWAVLFGPTERIAIKVNAFSDSVIWTHAPLVTAVTDSLQTAGIPAENITIYDNVPSELEAAGFTVNEDGPGVRCFVCAQYGEPIALPSGGQIRLSNPLLNCDALINMPVFKAHFIAGLTYALKNHFGSVQFPEGLHYPIETKIAELNSLPQIKDRTRLVIGDVLEANIRCASGLPFWKADLKGDAITLSFDPVAHDAYALDLLLAWREAAGETTESVKSLALDVLTAAAKAGLGTDQRENMDVVEFKLPS
jgi:hypothetical protein